MEYPNGKFNAIINNKEDVQIELDKNGFIANGESQKWSVTIMPDGKFHILLDGKTYLADIMQADHREKTYLIMLNNNRYKVQLKDKFDELVEKLGMADITGIRHINIKSPMPGMILKVMVGEGDIVEENTPLIVLKAMKMENIIKSPGNGQVKKVLVKSGDSVEKNHILIEF